MGGEKLKSEYTVRNFIKKMGDNVSNPTKDIEGRAEKYCHFEVNIPRNEVSSPIPVIDENF